MWRRQFRRKGAFTGTATRVLAGAAPALTALVPAIAQAAAPMPTPPSTFTPTSIPPPWSTPTPAPNAENCHYVVDAKRAIPVRSGPGKAYEKRGELQPSDEPITTTCATKGHGPDHWMQFRSGEFENLWVWRD